MKYESDNHIKRRHKNNLTRGAFGKCRNPPAVASPSKPEPVFSWGKRLTER